MTATTIFIRLLLRRPSLRCSIRVALRKGRMARPRDPWHAAAVDPVVVMGVSGAGKTAVGRALAARLDVPFCEGDSLHSPASISKMHAGIALTDEDRAPWLDRVAAWLAANPGGVATCSALRRAYRDRLRAAAPATRFVLLDVPEPVLRERLRHRPGHFMPASLLDSQLATLERPAPDEHAIVATEAEDARGTAERIAALLEA